MYSKVVIVLCVGIVWAGDDFRVLDSIRQEEPCSSKGGMCTIAADCPEGYEFKETYLCPRQQGIGVECCYSVSVKETRCYRRGGACVPDDSFCNPRLVFNKATDCSTGTKCCILV